MRKNSPPALRAAYALPPGVPALQADPAFTRRAFGAAILAGLGVGSGIGYWLRGDDQAAAAGARTSRKLAWAKRLAVGPLDALVAGHVVYLAIFEQVGADPDLIHGVARLSEHARAKDDVDGLRERLSEALDAFGDELPRPLVAHREAIKALGSKPGTRR